MRHPFGRLARISLLQHLVDLFEREAFGFGHQEVCEQCRQDAERTPQEEHFGAQVSLTLFGSNEIGCDRCDDL